MEWNELVPLIGIFALMLTGFGVMLISTFVTKKQFRKLRPKLIPIVVFLVLLCFSALIAGDLLHGKYTTAMAAIPVFAVLLFTFVVFKLLKNPQT